MSYVDKAKTRNSIVKTVRVSEKITVDIIKTNHFLDRHSTRSLDFSKVLSIAENSINKVLTIWQARKLKNTVGVLQKGNLNVMFGVHHNDITKHIDLEIVSAMEKKNFITDNIPDAVVIRV